MGIMDTMKMMRQEESERIGKIIQEITGIMKDNRCDRCISEDRGTMRQRSKEGEGRQCEDLREIQRSRIT